MTNTRCASLRVAFLPRSVSKRKQGTDEKPIEKMFVCFAVVPDPTAGDDCTMTGLVLVPSCDLVRSLRRGTAGMLINHISSGMKLE